VASQFRTGLFLISLDFELYWGVRDKRSLEAYGEQLRHTRQAVLKLLSLFQAYGIHATWSTVGFLLLESREALFKTQPAQRPGYRDENLCPYTYSEHEAHLETEVHFAPDLAQRIADTKGQEIGTHTFSHFYCLEDGVSSESFSADLQCAQEVGRRAGLPPESLVFPRNQWRDDFLRLLPGFGIRCYRGVEAHPIYRATPGREQGSYRRALRLLDSYLNLTGHHTFGPVRCGRTPSYNLPASRFLRPYSKSLAWLDPLKKKRIVSSMRYAAQNRQAFHLWWHPHNFGQNLEANLAFLESILLEYSALYEQYGFRSMNMKEMTDELENGSLTTKG
jgi:polysaccharide deacetylase